MNERTEDEEKIANGQVYEETYTMRTQGRGISTSVPKIVVKRKANELGISIEEIKEKYQLKAMFDNFTDIDVAYQFVKKPEYSEEG